MSAYAIGDFDELRTAVERTNGRSVPAVQALLKHIRMAKLRESELVVRYGSTLVDRQAALGDEYWSVLEQVFLAALDVDERPLAQRCLQSLNEQFPESTRVKRLVGISREAMGKYGEAEEIYKGMLEENPANQLVLKRQVCVLKAQGKIPAAIKQLNNYLKQFQADTNAWQELADLYLSVSKYEQAAFCYEELVLANPTSHINHCKLGEIYYTLGGKHIAKARKYFAQSLDLKKSNNARALHGLAACCHANMIVKDRSVRTDVTAALHEYASDELLKLYSEQSPVMLPQVEAILDTQRAAIEK